MKLLATLFLFLTLIWTAGCAGNSGVTQRSPDSRVTEYRTVLNTYERQRADDSELGALLSSADSLVRRAETSLSVESSPEKVHLILDAAEAKLVEVSTMMSLKKNMQNSSDIREQYADKASEIQELRKQTENELPPIGESE